MVGCAAMKRTNLSKVGFGQVLGLIFVFWGGLAFADESLLFTVDLYRHGDRAPVVELPKHFFDAGAPVGELTEVGRLQQVEEGKKLLEEYTRKFHVYEDFYPPQLKIRTTQRGRTQASALALLEGMYPKLKDPSSVLTSVARAEDILVIEPKDEAWKLEEAKLWAEAISPEKVALWERLSGLEIKKWSDLNKLGDQMIVRDLKKFPQPEGFPTEDVAYVMAVTQAWRVKKCTQSRDALESGKKILAEVRDLMVQTAIGASLLKSMIWVAHDSTILAVTAALGHPLKEIPKYSSRLHLGLWDIDGELFVRASYNGAQLGEEIRFHTFGQ